MVKARYLIVLLFSVASGSPNVSRNMNALHVFDEAYSTVSAKRNLRSNVAMTTSDHVEERAPLPINLSHIEGGDLGSVVMNLIKNCDAAKAVARAQSYKNKGVLEFDAEDMLIADWIDELKSAEDVFDILKLQTSRADLFDSEEFFMWADFVYLQNGKNLEVQHQSMYTVLSRHSGSDRLLNGHLLARLERNDKGFRGMQFARNLLKWPAQRVEEGKTPLDVFREFDLNLKGSSAYEMRSFSLWSRFVKLWAEKNDVDEYILKTPKKFRDYFEFAL